MLSAIRLFSEKGYFSTSVQEIADNCAISKGTLYKFFDSKEDLLIQVIDQSHKKLLQNALNVNLESTLSPKEKLIKKMLIQMEGFLENKHFISMLLQTIPDQHDTQIIHLIRRIKMTMLNWYKECLTEAYGTKVKPYIWDFSIMFQGVVREYTSLSLKENKDIDFHRVAYFVVEAFERMIDHSTGLTPVLTSREMADYEHFGLGMEPAPPVEQFRELLTELQNKIRQSQVAAQTREELLAAVACLQQEVQAPHPRGFLIQSLLLYLKKIQTYEPVVRRIEVVLQAVFTEEK